jgi:uncharacterized membrane protein YtjA (UPF0391 family)
MLGWMILFALMALIGASPMLAGHPPGTAAWIASITFAFLFVIALLTRAMRGRAR